MGLYSHSSESIDEEELVNSVVGIFKKQSKIIKERERLVQLRDHFKSVYNEDLPDIPEIPVIYFDDQTKAKDQMKANIKVKETLDSLKEENKLLEAKVLALKTILKKKDHPNINNKMNKALMKDRDIKVLRKRKLKVRRILLNILNDMVQKCEIPNTIPMKDDTDEDLILRNILVMKVRKSMIHFQREYYSSACRVFLHSFDEPDQSFPYATEKTIHLMYPLL